MNRELGRIRIELARPGSVVDGAVDIAGSGEGATGVAVTLRPTRSAFDQALVSGGGFVMTAAIAEQPRAKVGDRLLPRLQLQGSAGAVDRILVLPAIKKSLPEPAIKGCAFVVGELAFEQIEAARRQLARSDPTLQAGTLCR
jgi:hypothetical protein